MNNKDDLLKVKKLFLKCVGYIDELIELSEKEDASEEEVAAIMGKLLMAQMELQSL